MRKKDGKILILPIYNNVKNKILIPNAITFKTTQIEMGGWIKINQELSQSELNHAINKATSKIKNRITNFAKSNEMYHCQSIAIIETTDVDKGKKKKNYQWVSINLTLYNKINIYDQSMVKHSCCPLIEDIIDNDINDDDVFNFIKKEKGIQQYGE
jgi:hypothetical protein